MKTDVKFIYNRYKALQNDRETWVRQWKTLAKLFYPNGYRDESLNDEFKKTHIVQPNIYDSIGVQSSKTTSAGLYGAMTSPSRPWFVLRPQDFDLEGSHEAKVYIDEVEKRMRITLLRSKFYNTMPEAYRQLVTFGTACVYGEADITGVRFNCLPCGTYVLDVDKNGRIDTVIRTLSMSIRQMQQEFGEDSLPETIRLQEQIKKSPETTRYTVYHAVMPRVDVVKKGKHLKIDINPLEREYTSVYFCLFGDSTKQTPYILSESGFDVFPFFPVRWDVSAGDVYGTSPAMDCLADTRTAQAIKKDALTASHMNVNPAMVASSSLVGDGINQIPGGITYVAGGTQPKEVISPLYQVNLDYSGAIAMLEDTRQQINSAMHVDLFRMFTDLDRRQITATEITVREQEKLVLLGHPLERMQDELFNPLIEWLYFQMDKYNYLPPPPDTLMGEEIKIEYTSAMAQAQKIASTSTIEQFTVFLANLANVNPEVLDIMNFDEAANQYAESLGVDASLLRSNSEIQSIRQAKQQQQQQMQAQAEMANMANMAKTLGDTPMNDTSKPSVLDSVIGGMGSL